MPLGEDNGMMGKRDPRIVSKIRESCTNSPINAKEPLASSLICERDRFEVYIDTSATCSVILLTPASEAADWEALSSACAVKGPVVAALDAALPQRP
jgi:hypothetical protein